jgi:phosphohistidine phosphatase
MSATVRRRDGRASHIITTMKLLIVRHAIAMEREDFAPTGKSDDLRPLTATGRRRMRGVAKGLATMVVPDLIATSPLTRAMETARILSRAYGIEIGATVDALRPDRSPDEFITWAKTQPADSTVAIVGHEPHLSQLIGWLTTGRDSAFVDLKKGGACLLDFEGPPEKCGATLLWLMRPSQLEALHE